MTESARKKDGVLKGLEDMSFRFPDALPLACRTGVIFCVFLVNRGESEAIAKRELREIRKKLPLFCKLLYH